jgi:hypothetical protein
MEPSKKLTREPEGNRLSHTLALRQRLRLYDLSIIHIYEVVEVVAMCLVPPRLLIFRMKGRDTSELGFRSFGHIFS